MNFLATFINVVTIVVLAVPGFVLRKCKLFPEKAASILAVLLLYVSQPFLMMSSIFNKPFDAAMLPNFAWVLGFAVALQLAVYFVSLLCFSRDKNEAARRAAVASSYLGNVGFMGIPVMEYAKDPLIIVVSNPADILTMEVQSVSGLPANRVIGSGTSLDTARFRCNISEPLGVDVEDVQAYILGEHGDSQVPVWSSATIAGLPLEEYLKQTGKELDRAEISEHTKTGGAEVIGLKGATFYGVAMAVSTIVENILRDSGAILPVAHVLDDSFDNWAGIAFSLPCRIGGNGIQGAFKVPMNEEEKAAMDSSAKILKDFWAQVKE